MIVKHFELGKYYKHATGKQISIVCKAKTTMYGNTFLAEQSDRPNFMPIGFDTGDHWEEISKEEWMKNFGVCDDKK